MTALTMAVMVEYWLMEPNGFHAERAEDQYVPRWSQARVGNEAFNTSNMPL